MHTGSPQRMAYGIIQTCVLLNFPKPVVHHWLTSEGQELKHGIFSLAWRMHIKPSQCMDHGVIPANNMFMFLKQLRIGS